MKKITFPLILLIVVFASCNKTKSTDHKIIGISQCSDDAWRRTMNDEMIREASFYPGFEVKLETWHFSRKRLSIIPLIAGNPLEPNEPLRAAMQSDGLKSSRIG
jgi:hypothetical protein